MVGLVANDLIQFVLLGNIPRCLCCLMESDSSRYAVNPVPSGALPCSSLPHSPTCSLTLCLHVQLDASYVLPCTLLWPQCCVYICSITLTLPDTKVLCMACKISQKATLIWSLVLHDVPSDDWNSTCSCTDTKWHWNDSEYWTATAGVRWIRYDIHMYMPGLAGLKQSGEPQLFYSW